MTLLAGVSPAKRERVRVFQMQKARHDLNASDFFLTWNVSYVRMHM